jgi:glycosyltransferase involved in cell wall biosynthesis
VRIAVDGRMLGWTGIGRYTSRLLTELAKLDDVNEYVVLVPNSPERWRPPGANFHTRVTALRPYSLAEQRYLPGELAAIGPDLVHFMHLNAPLRYRRAYVLTVHDLTMLRFRNAEGKSLRVRLRYEAKLRAFRRVAKGAVRGASIVLVDSVHTRERLAGDLGRRDGVVVAYPGVDHLGSVRPTPLRLGVESPFLLYVGNCYPHKNLGVLLAALAQLAAEHEELRMVLAGPPDYFQRRVAADVEASGLSDRVAMPGHVTDGELAWLYQHAAALVFPSRVEGFGLPGLEAMAQGLPVIASRASCFPEVYGEAARYFDPSDCADLVTAIRQVLTDSHLRSDMVRRGYVRATRYSWRQTAEQVLNSYERALATSDPREPHQTALVGVGGDLVQADTTGCTP